jgi:hypothetical protein
MSRTTYLVLAVAARVLTDGPLLWMFVLVHLGWRGEGDGGAPARRRSAAAILASAGAFLGSASPRDDVTLVVAKFA